MSIARNAQRLFMNAHVRLYELTNGAIGKSFAGLPCLLLETTGSKSGLQRTTPLGYAKHGEDFIVVASNGGSDRDPTWLQNLEKEPRVTLRIGAEELEGTTRVLMPGQRHYDEIFSLINARFGGRYYHYQQRTPRPIPLVIITTTA